MTLAAGAVFVIVCLILYFEGQNIQNFFSSALSASGSDSSSSSSSSDPNAPGPGDMGAPGTEEYNPVGSPADGSTGGVPFSKIQLMANAIATAEGFYVAGSVPQRSNNPGDLTKSWGFSTTGTANSEGVLIFATLENDGWPALYTQVAAMLSGSSTVYTLDDSFLTVAQKYTGNAGAAAWAANVLRVMAQGGFSLAADNTLGDFVSA